MLCYAIGYAPMHIAACRFSSPQPLVAIRAPFFWRTQRARRSAWQAIFGRQNELRGGTTHVECAEMGDPRPAIRPTSTLAEEMLTQVGPAHATRINDCNLLIYFRTNGIDLVAKLAIERQTSDKIECVKWKFCEKEDVKRKGHRATTRNKVNLTT